ncbi:hypothetical protein D6D12_07865 [Aureobasidium pullulans]|uniref:WH1 domain-containing protein n=1 Tax=Aureobasidium pullulans TaxID=5580 RepID=A0AB74JKL6_AURPU|nr:hypothetical protein D6D12_07865 [Aureobasidium pullulans]THX53775.1 hypothetical protein D6D11_04354 [Aureobasidium pullulans]
MSSSVHVTIPATARGRYSRLCEVYSIRPSAEALLKVRQALFPMPSRFDERMQPSLLFYLPMSALVYRAGTLLVGWTTLENGSRQEIWVKQRKTRLLAYSERGGPPGSLHVVKRHQVLCDEWHPALDGVFGLDTSNDRREQYAYFSACIKLLESANPPPMIEDFRPPAARPQRQPVAISRRLAATRIMPSTRDRLAAETQRQTMGSETPSLIQRPQPRAPITPSSTFSSSLVPASCDLKPPPTKIFEQVNHESPIAPAGQELRTMLQSKKVDEIQAMLAERSADLPLWIKKIAEEEMDKKMRHDLDVLKNFF